MLSKQRERSPTPGHALNADHSSTTVSLNATSRLGVQVPFLSCTQPRTQKRRQAAVDRNIHAYLDRQPLHVAVALRLHLPLLLAGGFDSGPRASHPVDSQARQLSGLGDFIERAARFYRFNVHRQTRLQQRGARAKP